MCGFVGVINNKNLDNIEAMTKAIGHRGPDAVNYDRAINYALGFCRLSIIDLNARSNQPMIDESRGIRLVFNGEIYNYKILRDLLKNKGHEFSTESDTEVVLRSYEEWGEDFVNHLRGMFAIAIIDGNKLVLARDHFGMKPLYYGYADDGALVFGSEVKGLVAYKNMAREINASELFSYLELQHMAGDNTMIKNIKRLPHGSIGIVNNINESKEIKIKKYFSFKLTDEINDLDEAVALIQEVVRESVDLHKNADVPLGTFLSGGIDSSYITALTMPEYTFSVGFKSADNKFDESVHARELSEILGIKNRTEIIDPSEVLNKLDDIIYYLDEPQANLSSIPLYFLSKLAREEVNVVLSGEGADELFGGYDGYRTADSLSKYMKLPRALRKFNGGLANIIPNQSIKHKLKKGAMDENEIFIGQANIADGDQVREIITKAYKNGYPASQETKKYFNGSSKIKSKQLVDLNVFMQKDIILKGDRMSMANSLEVRMPFLDLGVYDVASKLTDDLKLQAGLTKYALRMAAKENLPEEWYNRPKKGFPVPFRYWLQEDGFYNKFKEVFTSPETVEFFKRDALMQLLDDHKEGRARNHRRLYSVYVFMVWCERMGL